MEIFTFLITGVSPLLQNNPKVLQSTADRNKSLGAKKNYTAEDDAEKSAYRNEKNQFIIPSIAFRSAILSASKGRRIGKMGAKAVLTGVVFPVEAECLLLDPATKKPIKNYEIHSTRAVINRAAIIKHRAMFKDWSCKLALEIDTEMLPDVGIVTQLLNIAGKIIGVQDWRPEKLGIYGRFTATLEE